MGLWREAVGRGKAQEEVIRKASFICTAPPNALCSCEAPPAKRLSKSCQLSSTSIMLNLSPWPPSSPFFPPSIVRTLLTSPLSLSLGLLHRLFLLLRGSPYPQLSSPIRLVCISDTHTQTLPSVSSGDILIHAGDLANTGTVSEIQSQVDWLASLPHKHKIVVAGNHDSYFDPRSRPPSDSDKTIEWGNIHYLQHSSVVLKFRGQGEGGAGRILNIYGAPQIPACGGDEMAFQYKREEDAWSGTVPADTDVLVTHTPPRWHLDLPRGMGCDFLLKELWRVRPRVHVFGHVHAGRGREAVFWDEEQKTYERLKRREGRWVFWGGSLGMGWCLDVLKLLVFGALGVLWTRVWGAEGQGTVMINAAVVEWSTGKIKYKAQVVDI
ncbi:hypothetical protein MMC30_000368 [Trapelia coarctata]|nr:hypothetical protein [Trapelia coarctata]